MGKSILQEKSFAFAIRILKLSDYLYDKKEFVLREQITKSGTSIGANVREGRNAQGHRDMGSKFSIALKEADETMYWLELLAATGKISQKEFESMEKDLDELISILVASIKTLKKHQ